MSELPTVTFRKRVICAYCRQPIKEGKAFDFGDNDYTHPDIDTGYPSGFCTSTYDFFKSTRPQKPGPVVANAVNIRYEPATNIQ